MEQLYAQRRQIEEQVRQMRPGDHTPPSETDSDLQGEDTDGNTEHETSISQHSGTGEDRQAAFLVPYNIDNILSFMLINVNNSLFLNACSRFEACRMFRSMEARPV